MPITLNKTIRLFLDSIGRREDYEFYLQKFKTDQTACFAIVALDRSGFDDVATVFTFDMEFLSRLELVPVILLYGKGGDEVRDLLCAGVHPYLLLGLQDGAESQDVETVIRFIHDARKQNKIPVLSLPGEDPTPLLLELIPNVAKRLHVIRARGPLRQPDEQPLFYYYTATQDRSDVAGEDQGVVELAATILEQRPGTHISVASPWKLLQELFTVKGAGCLIRRGSAISTITDMATVDMQRLRFLLEQSFGKKIKTDSLLHDVATVYLEENYRGAALLKKHVAGMYLSKFAVGKEARGEGLAQEMWRSIRHNHPSLFWRARNDNPINHWYEKQADGCHRLDTWRIFWRGIKWEQLPDIIQYCLEQQDDFEMG